MRRINHAGLSGNTGDVNRPLERCEKRGLLDLLADAEPVTGFARVRTENVVENYRFRLDSLGMPEFTESALASTDEPSAVRATP